MNDLKVAYKDITSIKDYENNSRTHTDKQIKQICRSIDEFGWTNPILIDESNTIIAGHARKQAAAMLGIDSVPTITIKDLKPGQREALVIADNRLAENAGWDETTIIKEIEVLMNHDFDLDLLGFKESELNRFINEIESPESLEKDDEVPEVDETVSVYGDIWLCGKHRVMCGDSVKTSDVALLVCGVDADMVYTDPPYGVGFYGKKFCPTAKDWSGILNDEKQGADLKEFIFSVFDHLPVKDSAPFYVWSAPLAEGYETFKGLINAGYKIQSQIVWVKNRFALGRADYHWRHENCWYGWKDGKNHCWNGGRKLTTVWEFEKDALSSYEHPMQKPVSLAVEAIGNSSKKGNIVIDVFLGSGSTLIAAEKTKRICYGMELDPQYVDVVINRYYNYTGEMPVLEETGETYDQVKELRCHQNILAECQS